MNHELKTWPKYFRPLARGEKNFEVRRNDRNFQVGDTLTLREYDPDTKTYTGAETDRTVTYVLPGNGFGVHADYCVLGLGEVEEESFWNAPPNPNGCWCRRCNPMIQMMILCPTCGNKRCPHATFHDYFCTDSNEPGQAGSDF